EKKDSIINSVHLGVEYQGKLPQKATQFHAGATVGGNLYTENPSHNNYVDAAGNIGLQGEKLALEESILYTSEPADSSLTARTKRLNNTVSVSYQTSHKRKISFGVSLQDLFDRYFARDMKYLNRNRVNAAAQLFYNFTPRTYAFVEYMFSDIVYQGNQENNSISHSAALGLTKKLSGKVTGTAKITYDARRYSHKIPHADNEPDLVGYYAEILWKPTSRDLISLSGERSMEETLYGTNRYFIDTFISVYMRHQLNAKWAGSMVVGWEDLRYTKAVTTHKRHDSLYTVRPSLEYNFKQWLIGSVWYQYRIRSSNEKWPDYVSNKIGCNLKVIF
ncbi:MAG: outer membrane beta-barrel protein, partial [Elusimicrobiaceae bacterium]|nr:outer membrane beta-barrel protein [Elusimicrobiaceae bacterium]